MKRSHPTADGIARPARGGARAVRLLLLVAVAAAALGGLGARAALAAEPTIQLALDHSAVPLGAPVTMTATVTSAVALPTGTVSFVDAASPGAPLAIVPLVTTGPQSATAVFTTSTLAAGTHSVYAAYNPDFAAYLAGLAAVQSASQTLVVGGSGPPPYETQVVLTTPSLDVDSTAPVTLTATVTEIAGTGTPTGTVSFSDIVSGSPIPLGPGPVPLVGGVAQLTIANFSVGPHQIVASYSGGGRDNGSSSPPLALNAHAPVDPRVSTTTTVTVSPPAIAVGDVVTITATILQVGSASGPAGGSVTFTSDSVYGSNVFIASQPLGTAPAGMTAAANQAIVSVPAWQAGSYVISASYFGSIFAHDSQGSAPLTVFPPRTDPVLSYNGATTVVFDRQATVSATVTDGAGAPLAGRSVTFTIGTGTCTATTDASGQASCTIVVLHDVGTTAVTADLARDLQTQAATTSRAFAVTPSPTAVTPDLVPGAGSSTLTGTLLTDAGTPVAGEPVTLTLGASSCTATTNSAGVASCVVASITGQPTATLTATYAGSLDYLPSAAGKVVPLMIPTTLAYTGATTGDYHDAVTLSARLLDVSGNPVADKGITLTVGSQSCAATTAADGVASCALTLSQPSGGYPVSATFAGQGLYLPSTGGAAFTVTREQTTVAVLTLGPVLRSAGVTLTGRLLEDGVTPIAGRTLTLTLGTLSCITAATDATGVASCTVPGSAPLGPTSTAAGFAGDATYLPASATGSALLYAFAPGGAFVVGDRSATGNVTFWGAKWSKLNAVSGGDAPDAFKGFAATGVPQCGTGWSTAPGNSTPPPAGPLPAYMAVLVTGSVAKTGPVLSGTTTHIVIVRTDAGYKSDPGHAGTGTVVATVC